MFNEQQADLALPHLHLCADTNTIHHLITTQWGMPAQSQVALARVRYRRGQRCILQFSVGDTHANSDWVSALVYPADQVADKWQKIQQRLGKDPSFANHATCVEALGLVLLRYPYDHLLTQLQRYTDESLPNDQAVVAAALGLDPQSISEAKVELLRYRYGISAVMRVTLHDAARTTRQAILKCYPDAQAQEAANALCRWNHAANAGEHNLSTVKPLMCLDADHSLLLSHAQGQLLEDLLMAGKAEETLRLLGRELAALHRSKLVLPKQHTQTMEAANLRRATTYLTEAMPERAVELSMLAEHIIAAQRWTMQLAPTHRDLKLDHLYIQDNALTLIDLDSCAMSDPLLDPALLIARLAAAPYLLNVSGEACTTAAQQFIDAYCEQEDGEAIRIRMAPFIAGAMLDVASGFCRRHENNWREAVDALIARAYGPVSNVIST